MPDQIKHALCIPCSNLTRSELALQFDGELFGACLDTKDIAKESEECDVIYRTIWMRDDDMRHKFLNLLERGEIVLVDIDNDVRRMQFAQNFELDVLGAAHLRHITHGVAWMNAESGAANHSPAKAQAEEKLGDRRYKRDDARV